MIFRAATMDDFDYVVSVIEDGRKTLAAQGSDQWQGKDPTPERIREDIRQGFTRVATDDFGTVLGTLALIGTGEPEYDHQIEGLWLTDDAANVIESGDASYMVMHRIAVSTAATRRGVATFLVSNSAEEARSRGFASLRGDTHRLNKGMQHTFEKCGMVQCCTIDMQSIDSGEKLRLGFELIL